SQLRVSQRRLVASVGAEVNARRNRPPVAAVSAGILSHPHDERRHLELCRICLSKPSALSKLTLPACGARMSGASPPRHRRHFAVQVGLGENRGSQRALSPPQISTPCSSA